MQLRSNIANLHFVHKLLKYLGVVKYNAVKHVKCDD